MGSFTPTASGARLDWNSTTVDGQNGSSQSWPGLFASPVSMGAIAEVKLVSDNYTAEYGGNMGTTIQIVSKSGTKAFTAASTGTSVTSNSTPTISSTTGMACQADLPFHHIRRRYRRTNLYSRISTATRASCFSFFPDEDWRVRRRPPEEHYRFQRSWSVKAILQTLDQTGRLITIRDPLSNGLFPNNVVLPNRLNPNGQVLLGINPMPNVLNRDITRGAYNFEFQELIRMPKRLEMLMMDYRPTTNDVISVTPRRMWVTLHGLPVARIQRPSRPGGLTSLHVGSAAVKWTHIFSPKLVNELITGVSGDKQNGIIRPAGLLRPGGPLQGGVQPGTALSARRTRSI